MDRGRTHSGVLFLVLVLGAVAGCAGSGGTRQLLRAGDYTTAVERLREEEAKRPADPAVKRDLGVALLESGDAEGGWRKLSEARSADPRDPQTLFFAGRAAEATGRDVEALSAYTEYLVRADRGLSRKGRAAVRARIEDLSREQALNEIRHALAREESLRTARVPENSLAVSDFLNTARSDTLAPLSRGLAAMVVTDLSKVRSLRVLERERLHVLLNELKLGTEETAADTEPLPAPGRTGVRSRPRSA